MGTFVYWHPCHELKYDPFLRMFWLILVHKNHWTFSFSDAEEKRASNLDLFYWWFLRYWSRSFFISSTTLQSSSITFFELTILSSSWLSTLFFSSKVLILTSRWRFSSLFSTSIQAVCTAILVAGSSLSMFDSVSLSSTILLRWVSLMSLEIQLVFSSKFRIRTFSLSFLS